MKVVADTSPLTALLHIKQIPLLKTMYGKVIIPSTVASELNTLITFGYDLSFLKEKETFIIQKAMDKQFIAVLSRQLDPGEAEAIALAKVLQADLLLIDEKLGKQLAEREQLACKGAIGVLIQAKTEGLLPIIKPYLDDLVNNLKFRLSEKIYKLALQKAGE